MNRLADGKVVIDVDLDAGKANKSIKTLDKNLEGAFQDKKGRWRAANGRFLSMKERADLLGKSVGDLEGKGNRASLGIGKIVSALGLVALGAKAINMVTNALDGAISRYDTLNNFPKVLQLMGFSAEDSSKAINRLSEGIDGLPTTLDSVASTAQRIAIMTKDLDGATETTLALNNAFLASGASAADAQRGLEQYVQMLAKGQVDLESWRSLQETMPVALNKTAEAFGFAGASAQNDLYEALKDGDITFDQFNKKIIELSNATGGFADMAKTGSTGIATSWQNMQTAIVKGVADVIRGIDEALGGVGSISGIIDKSKDNIKTFFNLIVTNIPVAVQWLTKIRDALEPWIPLIASVIAGIIAFNTTISVINGVKTAITAVKVAWASLNATILANPIALVIAAIIAAAILIYTYWEPIKEFFIQLWDGIKISGLALWESLKAAWNTTVAWLMGIWTPIEQFFTNLWSKISNIFQSAFGVIKTIVSTWLEIIKSLFAAYFLTLVYLVTGQWDKIREVWAAAITKIIGLIQSMWQDIMSRWNGFSQKVLQMAVKFVSNLLTKWAELKSKIATRTAEIITSVVSFFAQLPSKVTSKLAQLATSITKKFTSIKGQMRKMGADMILGLISGVTSMAKRLVSKVVDTVSGAVNKAKNFLGIKSPSRLMRDLIGKNMMLGWEVGIERESDAPRQAMDKATGQLLNSLKGNTVNSLLRGVLPSNASVGAHSVVNNNYTNNYDDEEIKALLRQIAEKDTNVYMDKEKVGSVIDHEQARRTNLFGRRVALD